MVSLRCKVVVKEALQELGLNYILIDLGVVELIEEITPDQYKQLKVLTERDQIWTAKPTSALPSYTMNCPIIMERELIPS